MGQGSDSIVAVSSQVRGIGFPEGPGSLSLEHLCATVASQRFVGKPSL